VKGIAGHGPPVSFVERSVLKMLAKLRVRFRHRTFVVGHEVDFLVARPGRRGLIIEVDGDLYHFDEAKRAKRDGVLEQAGWDVVHFWGSEVVQTPKLVLAKIETELEGVPRIPKKTRRRPRGRL